ncbi:MAG: TOBE domain-containing protein [Pseudomonas sp.]
MQLEGQFWITHNGKNLAGQSRIELLTQIASSGSITQAAKAVGISYKSAWDAVEAMNSAAGSPLVARSTGGKGGGGTQLTAAGQQLIDAFQHYQREHQAFLQRLGADSRLEPYLQIMERLRLRTSARNQLLARVCNIQADGLNDRIDLELHGSAQHLTALITHSSTERLNLQLSAEVFALIKASWVNLLPADGAPVHAEPNHLTGNVHSLEPGELESELHLQLHGGAHLTAMLSNSQLSSRQLVSGEQVSVRINPEQIILCSV